MLSLPNPVLLGSKSPRRREILKMAGIDFEVIDIDYEEITPEAMASKDVPIYLAEQKALHGPKIEGDELLITADTLVILDDEIIGKPRDKEDAFNILQRLSGKMHTVVSGVCLLTKTEKILLSDTTDVYFKLLDMKEIEYYIDHYDVLDKAGAYGIQDWIGLIGIEKIDGSYFNVMGFPINQVYEQLKMLANH